MNIFLRILGKVTGRPVTEAGMTVAHDGRTSPSELSFLAGLSNRLWRRGFKFAPPGKPRNLLTTSDLDPKTKKPYPNYLERRKREGSPRVILVDGDLVMDEVESEKNVAEGKEGYAGFSKKSFY